ncbi:ketosteroid isomerase family protein [Faecalicatena sp. AGMB00832]|uniref:Ketosteroid isomerase family protein n=1 Tax=Faecalicatena faecalis TaxID=2726362 RepID=A0ABS6D427_9FIRM|nr:MULTISPECIES: ketosteroid isomerase family protein [Faecalicatena]MBU3876248.1 ketosteroid isomerase family protein [Faecalicatena faecalis]MCI6464100.1 ketosteroid isomerase family protein [Faecalicatena sp.]MDY5619174.1 ketosteroid isomerase family protein [Lachnospiraceae bacterium]
MNIIQKYIETMENRDYEGLAELFDCDGTLVDHCPKGTLQPEYHVYGKEAINMFFRNKFTFGKFSISEPEIIDERHAKFVANYSGYMVMAIATIRYTNEEGLIQKLSVRPK